jgi:hypothetical protein
MYQQTKETHYFSVSQILMALVSGKKKIYPDTNGIISIWVYFFLPETSACVFVL